MKTNFKWRDYHPSPLLKAVQIFLLVLIILGIGLIFTQKLWVSYVVDYLIKDEKHDTTPQVGMGLTSSVVENKTLSQVGQNMHATGSPKTEDGIKTHVWQPDVEQARECEVEITADTSTFGVYGLDVKKSISSRTYSNADYGFKIEIPGYWQVCEKKGYVEFYEPNGYVHIMRETGQVWVVEKSTGESLHSVAGFYSGFNWSEDKTIHGDPVLISQPLEFGDTLSVIEHEDKIYVVGNGLDLKFLK